MFVSPVNIKATKICLFWLGENQRIRVVKVANTPRTGRLERPQTMASQTHFQKRDRLSYLGLQENVVVQPIESCLRVSFVPVDSVRRYGRLWHFAQRAPLFSTEFQVDQTPISKLCAMRLLRVVPPSDRLDEMDDKYLKSSGGSKSTHDTCPLQA